jgi:putative nucleotidyltransferase with HDIG domain
MAITLRSPENALRLLVELGAPPWLVRHHELVVEAASVLCQRVPAEVGVSFDRDEVLLGAALHDVGKILHPDEMKAPGHRHESAGQSLLVERGVPPEIARFCVTHASWDTPERTLEDLLVALADKLWKGKREEELEARVIQMIAAHSKREQWEVFEQLDSICEQIAADGTSRLARSVT